MRRNRRRNPEEDLALSDAPAYVAMAEPVLAPSVPVLESAKESNGALMFLVGAGALMAAWYWWTGRTTATTQSIATAADEEYEEEEEVPEPAPSGTAPKVTVAPRPFARFQPRIASGDAPKDPRTSIPGTRFEPGPPGARG